MIMLDMLRVLIDTGVWMSYSGKFRDAEQHRIERAKSVIDYLHEHKDLFEICYSERTERELKKYEIYDMPLNASLLPSHIADQTWGETEEIWNNIGTTWGDEEEIKLGKEIQSKLPNKTKKINRNDRGIFADAIQEGCRVLIHENPRDYNELTEEAEKYGVVLIDLINTDYNTAREILTNIANENTVIPLSAEDPILGLGEQPVVCDAPDASEAHDRYLYGPAR